MKSSFELVKEELEKLAKSEKDAAQELYWSNKSGEEIEEIDELLHYAEILSLRLKEKLTFKEAFQKLNQ